MKKLAAGSTASSTVKKTTVWYISNCLIYCVNQSTAAACLEKGMWLAVLNDYEISRFTFPDMLEMDLPMMNPMLSFGQEQAMPPELSYWWFNGGYWLSNWNARMFS